MSGVLSQTRFYRRRFRNVLAGSPMFYLPLRRITMVRNSNLLHDGHLYRDTDILIDGYPRSANSFAEAAFRLAQPRPIKMAHHSHAAAQIIQAARWEIPSLVLIRDPVEAARSLVMHQPNAFDVKTALSEYIFFYKSIEPWRDSFILANFEAVTNDFGAVIDAINDRFCMAFSSFKHSQESELAVFDKVDETSRERGTIPIDGVETYSPRADPVVKAQREARKREVQAAIAAPESRFHVEQARDVYFRLTKTGDI